MVDLIGTFGPASAETDVLTAMLEKGLTGMRLNLSHAGLPDSARWLQNLAAAERRTGRTCLRIIDLQGPELRIGALAAPLALERGATVRLGQDGVPVPELILPRLSRGQAVLLDDGKLLLTVLSSDGAGADCRVERGGTLLPHKSLALPGLSVEPPTLTGADLANLARAGEFGVTGVMQPFVRNREDLLVVRAALQRAGLPDARIYAKVENAAGVARLPELLPHADEIVIARGDLGNAVPLWTLPRVQKEIAAVCRAAGKPFAVATQMLASMERAPVPTRAEVSDVYNAVLDGASSLIVTGETAVGRYPVEVVDYLARTAQEALVSREAGKKGAAQG